MRPGLWLAAVLALLAGAVTHQAWLFLTAGGGLLLYGWWQLPGTYSRGPFVLGRRVLSVFVPSRRPGVEVTEYRLAPGHDRVVGGWWGWVQHWPRDPREQA